MTTLEEQSEKRFQKLRTFAKMELIGAAIYIVFLIVSVQQRWFSWKLPAAGFGLALVWELAHYFSDNISVHPEVDKVMPGVVYPITHALYDSILFVAIYYSVKLLTGTECSYSLKHFSLYLAIGVSQAIVFELMFAGKGRVWRYKTGPDYINEKITDSLTVLPVVEWAIASIAWFLLVPKLRLCISIN